MESDLPGIPYLPGLYPSILFTGLDLFGVFHSAKNI
jgi:hypothetical protein